MPKVEPYEEIEKRIMSLSHNDRDEIEDDIRTLRWQKELYEHMYQRMTQRSKNNTEVSIAMEEAIVEIDDILAMAYDKHNQLSESHFRLG